MKTYIVKNPADGRVIYESEFLAEAMHFAPSGYLILMFNRLISGGTELSFVGIK